MEKELTKEKPFNTENSNLSFMKSVCVDMKTTVSSFPCNI